MDGPQPPLIAQQDFPGALALGSARTVLDISGVARFDTDGSKPRDASGAMTDVTANGGGRSALSHGLVFAAEDTTFAGPGRGALSTKADSVTHFDTLTITSLDRSRIGKEDIWPMR